MKKLLIVFASLAVLTACNNNAASDAMDKAAEAAEEGMENAEGAMEKAGEMAENAREMMKGGMTINTEKSVVNWTGKKLTGEHHGTIKFKSGNVRMGDGMMSASFVVDMTTIDNVDMAADAENKGKLEGHLKSPDFFDVANYPEASFESNNIGVGEGEFKGAGKLTIKGHSEEVMFNGVMSDVEEGGKMLVANFVIDRAKYDVRYGSKTFFESIGDKIIYDEVPVSVTVYCN